MFSAFSREHAVRLENASILKGMLQAGILSDKAVNKSAILTYMCMYIYVYIVSWVHCNDTRYIKILFLYYLSVTACLGQRHSFHKIETSLYIHVHVHVHVCVCVDNTTVHS